MVFKYSRSRRGAFAEEKKRPASFSRDKAFTQTLCGTTLGCRPLTGRGRSSPAVTGRCFIGHQASLPTHAQSFSRRLQGDFHPAFPAASHRNSGSLRGNRRATRPFPRQMFHFTGLSYHIFPVCQGGFCRARRGGPFLPGAPHTASTK